MNGKIAYDAYCAASKESFPTEFKDLDKDRRSAWDAVAQAMIDAVKGKDKKGRFVKKVKN